MNFDFLKNHIIDQILVDLYSSLYSLSESITPFSYSFASFSLFSNATSWSRSYNVIWEFFSSSLSFRSWMILEIYSAFSSSSLLLFLPFFLITGLNKKCDFSLLVETDLEFLKISIIFGFAIIPRFLSLIIFASLNDNFSVINALNSFWGRVFTKLHIQSLFGSLVYS